MVRQKMRPRFLLGNLYARIILCPGQAVKDVGKAPGAPEAPPFSPGLYQPSSVRAVTEDVCKLGVFEMGGTLQRRHTPEGWHSGTVR
jgi:hypothetical protein